MTAQREASVPTLELQTTQEILGDLLRAWDQWIEAESWTGPELDRLGELMERLRRLAEPGSYRTLAGQ